MGELVFKISNVDFLPYVVLGGIQSTENDIDSDEAGMLLDGTMRRDRVNIRYHIAVNPSNKELTTEEKNILMQALSPEWVDVETNAVGNGSILNLKFYCSKRAATPVRQYKGKIIWRLEPFNLSHDGVGSV